MVSESMTYSQPSEHSGMKATKPHEILFEGQPLRVGDKLLRKPTAERYVVSSVDVKAGSATVIRWRGHAYPLTLDGMSDELWLMFTRT